MLAQLRKLFDQIGAGDDIEVRDERDVRMISAALMAEVATVDQNLDERERATLERLLCEHYALDAESSREMVAEALDNREHTTSLYEFTQAVNAQFNEAQKYQLVRQMWQVAFSDGVVDAFEEHLIRRVSDLIYLPHGLFTRARAEARDLHRG